MEGINFSLGKVLKSDFSGYAYANKAESFQLPRKPGEVEQMEDVLGGLLLTVPPMAGEKQPNAKFQPTEGKFDTTCPLVLVCFSLLAFLKPMWPP